MSRAAVRGAGVLDVESPQKYVPGGGDAYFVDVGFADLRGGEPYERWAVYTREYEALSTGERGDAQVLVAMISRWDGMNDPFVLVVPLGHGRSAERWGRCALRTKIARITRPTSQLAAARRPTSVARPRR